MIHQSKRAIIISGGKGGTGKTTTARGILDIYSKRGIHCAPFECDKGNAQLKRHYDQKPFQVMMLDVYSHSGFDDFIEHLDLHQPDVALIDMPAGSNQSLEELATANDLFHELNDMGYATTLVGLITRVKDSVISLRLLMQAFQDQVDYVAFKNLWCGAEDAFVLYQRSNTRKELLEKGGKELWLPSLDDGTYDLIDSQNLSFREVVETTALSRPHRSRVRQWLNVLEREMEKASSEFGLVSPQELDQLPDEPLEVRAHAR